MRMTFLFLLIWVGLPAAAEGCTFRYNIESSGVQPHHMRSFANCVNRELSELRREQRRLNERLDEYEAAFGELPAPYLNEDGVVTREEGRAIGKATVILSARQTGGASSLALDNEVLEALCSETGGCTVSVFMKVYGFREQEAIETVSSGRCSFTYEPDTDSWTRGAGCNDLPAASGSDRDGNALEGDGGGEIIASAGEACIFADADTDTFVEADRILARDREEGFFLIAAPVLRGTASRRFRCELVME